MRRWIALLLCTGFARASAQRATIAGHVNDARSKAPVAGANVFILGGLDGALTDTTGRFSFSTMRQAPYTVVVTRVGYRDSQRVVTDSLVGEILISLESE